MGEALATGERTGQHYWDAELHRLRGALTLQSGGRRAGGGSESAVRRGKSKQTAGPLAGSSTAVKKDAESCFLEAIEIARRQETKAFELRAATSLSRLWAGQEKTEEAHALLSDIYSWFSEGFDTADLSAARSLRDGLARRTAGVARVPAARSGRVQKR